MKCPNCGVDLPEDSRFCFDCGSAIAPPAPPPPAYQPTPPPPPPTYSPPPPPPAYAQPARPTHPPPPPPKVARPPAPSRAARPPRKKTGLYLGLGAGLLVLCLVIVVAGAGVSGQFGFLPYLPAIFPTSLPSPDIGSSPAGETQATVTPWLGPTPTFSFMTPCSNGQELLADNFDRDPPQAQALLDQTVMRFWQSQAAGILQGGSQSQSLVSPVIYPTFQAADFNLEITVIPQTLQGDDGFGIIFRGVQNGNNLSSFYIVYIKPNQNQVVFSTRIDPNWSEYQSSNLLPDSLGIEGGGRVRLEVLQDHFRVFVNDRYETTFQSATLTQPGLIGLALLTAAGETTEEVHFNNLIVYAPGACP